MGAQRPRPAGQGGAAAQNVLWNQTDAPCTKTPPKTQGAGNRLQSDPQQVAVRPAWRHVGEVARAVVDELARR